MQSPRQTFGFRNAARADCKQVPYRGKVCDRTQFRPFALLIFPTQRLFFQQNGPLDVGQADLVPLFSRNIRVDQREVQKRGCRTVKALLRSPLIGAFAALQDRNSLPFARNSSGTGAAWRNSCGKVRLILKYSTSLWATRSIRDRISCRGNSGGCGPRQVSARPPVWLAWPVAAPPAASASRWLRALCPG